MQLASSSKRNETKRNEFGSLVESSHNHIEISSLVRYIRRGDWRVIMRISNRYRELIFSVRPLVQSITCPWRNTHAMQLAGDALFPFPLPLTHPVSLTLSPLSFSGREREAERPGDAGALSKTGSLELHSHYAAIHEICQPFGFRAVGVSHNFFQNSPHVVPSRHVVLAISRIVAASPFPSSWLRKYAKWMELEEWTSFLIMSLSQCAQMIFIR